MASCSKCQSPLLDGGFITPTPARAEKGVPHPDEAQYLKFTQGGGGMTVEAMLDAKPLCTPCYVEAFAVCYPDAAIPKLPDNRYKAETDA